MKNTFRIPIITSRTEGKVLQGIAVITFLLMIICAPGLTCAQDTTSVRRDTVIVESRDTVLLQGGPDTVAIESYAKRFDPRKAILYAAILPGLGQAYNKKYWKLPLVYGGIYAIGYGINWYNKLHREYRAYLFQNLEEGVGPGAQNPNLPDPFDQFTTSQIRTAVDKARRERDFMIILMGGMYLLQMVDAHVDAHLKEFDLNPKLQVSLEPAVDQNMMAGRTIGVALVVKF